MPALVHRWAEVLVVVVLTMADRKLAEAWQTVDHKRAAVKELAGRKRAAWEEGA